ncbi:MAG: Omp28-related outer membrane protein, partial [Bacteroidota bacterium]
HQIANGIYNADPTNVVLINIHSGGYANVAPGEPDLKTAEGNAIDPMPGMGITGYPAGDMNRTVLSSTVMAGGRGLWSGWATTIKSQAAYCNVALQGTVDVTTRVLTVVAQVYYTANSPSATNSLTIFLLEDKVIGPQHNYGAPVLYNAANYNPDGSYNHNHVLRKGLTPTFGITIPVTTAGTTFTTSVTYTVPLTFGVAGKTNPCLLGNLSLAAFVTETNQPTINGNHGPITLTGFANSLDITPTTLQSPASICSGINTASSFKFSNLGSTPVTSAVFSYAYNGAAATNYSWTGTVNPMTQALTINLPQQTITPLASNSLVVTVVSVNGVADQNAANDVASNTMPLTTVIANNLSMQMDFTQDRYGSEDSWVVKDEVTGTTISSDGPFADLAANGILLHSKAFTIGANTCYKLVVTDAYGDGVNGGYGVGGYVLNSGATPIITSNGQYGTGETKLYKSALATSIFAPELNISDVRLFPNPTATTSKVSIVLSQNETISVLVLNSLGQEVYTSLANNYNAGTNEIILNTENWAVGIYNINIATSKGSVNKKLTVIK